MFGDPVDMLKGVITHTSAGAELPVRLPVHGGVTDLIRRRSERIVSGFSAQCARLRRISSRHVRGHRRAGAAPDLNGSKFSWLDRRGAESPLQRARCLRDCTKRFGGNVDRSIAQPRPSHPPNAAG